MKKELKENNLYIVIIINIIYNNKLYNTTIY